MPKNSSRAKALRKALQHLQAARGFAAGCGAGDSIKAAVNVAETRLEREEAAK